VRSTPDRRAGAPAGGRRRHAVARRHGRRAQHGWQLRRPNPARLAGAAGPLVQRPVAGEPATVGSRRPRPGWCGGRRGTSSAADELRAGVVGGCRLLRPPAQAPPSSERPAPASGSCPAPALPPWARSGAADRLGFSSPTTATCCATPGATSPLGGDRTILLLSLRSRALLRPRAGRLSDNRSVDRGHSAVNMTSSTGVDHLDRVGPDLARQVGVATIA
jgi:hypothetical protein